MRLGKYGMMVKSLIEQGFSVEYGPLTICNLGDYVPTRIPLERKYQVFSTDRRVKCEEVYTRLDVAVDKFMGLKMILDKRNDDALPAKPTDNQVPIMPLPLIS
jgi:hypothetical protein